MLLVASAGIELVQYWPLGQKKQNILVIKTNRFIVIKLHTLLYFLAFYLKNNVFVWFFTHRLGVFKLFVIVICEVREVGCRSSKKNTKKLEIGDVFAASWR